MNLELSKDERYQILIFKASVSITTAYAGIIRPYVPIRRFLRHVGIVRPPTQFDQWILGIF